MFCEGTVAGFAIYARVLAGFLNVKHIAVTVFTRLVSGKPRFSRGDFFQRVAPIVAVLAEAFWNECRSCEEKYCEADDEDCRQPQKMLYILHFCQGSILGRLLTTGDLGPGKWFM